MNKRARSGSLVKAEDAVSQADAILTGPAAEWEKEGLKIFKEVRDAYEEAKEAARVSEDPATALIAVAKLALAMAELQLKYTKAASDSMKGGGAKFVVIQNNPRNK